MGLGMLPICIALTTATIRGEAGEPKRTNPMLIETKQLNSILADRNLRVLDTRSSEEYAEGHIPGAVHVDVGDWKSLAISDRGLYDQAGWDRKLGAVGITSDSRVVVYGDRLTDSVRIWWLLKYVGVNDVALLNGGWKTWETSAGSVTTSTPTLKTTTFHSKFQASRLVEMESLKNSLGTPKLKVVDTRSDREYSDGRIPGSVHLEWTELVNEDGRFKTKAQLRELFRNRGIVPGETAVCY